MLITDNKKLKDIKAEFHAKFPFLKLEFYIGKHESHKPSPARQQLDPEKTIGEVRSIHVEGDLGIDAHLKVSTLEDRFWENYGLNVQVFRRSGNLWLQTSASDEWTLAEQNRKGEHSEHAFEEMR
ncbi:MAG: hypothetical protein AAB316_02035 [Bacteroidota bacterium]